MQRGGVLPAFLALALALAPMGAGSQARAEAASDGSGAVLRALDKVNGRTVDLELPSGQVATMFGLAVLLVKCRYPSDNPSGDAYAFLRIREEGNAEVEFEGWMIASSPALSAMDHARYDVWVLRCMTS